MGPGDTVHFNRSLFGAGCWPATGVLVEDTGETWKAADGNVATPTTGLTCPTWYTIEVL